MSDDGLSRLVEKVGEVSDTVLVEAGVVVSSGVRETLEMFSYYMRSITDFQFVYLKSFQVSIEYGLFFSSSTLEEERWRVTI